MSMHKNVMTLCCAAAFALGLAACSSDSEVAEPPPPPPPMEPDPVDVERDAIDDAIADAMAAAAMVMDDSTDSLVAAADMAVAAAMEAIDDATLISSGDVSAFRASLAAISADLDAAKSSRTMAMTLASQRMAIADAISAAMTAVGMVNDMSDDATVTAAEDAVMAATAAIGAASDIPLSEAQAAETRVAAIQGDLDDAKESRQMAMDAADEEDRLAREAEQRRMMQVGNITDAIDAARMAVAAVNDTSDDDTVMAADTAIAAARLAIAGAADVSETDKSMYSGTVDTLAGNLMEAKDSRTVAMETIDQRMAITDAIDTAKSAVGAVDDVSTDEEVMTADDAVAAVKTAIADASHLSADEKAAFNTAVGALEDQLADAKTSRMMAMDDAERKQNDMMAVTAAKLYAGIDAQNGANGAQATVAAGNPLSAGERAAAYNNGDVPTAGTAAGTRIMVGIGTTTVALSEDKETTVAALGAWTGKRYTDAPGGDMYEAVVYSNVEDPKEGQKFSVEYSANITNGVLNAATTTGTPTRVASPSFDHTVGLKEFKFPDPNLSGSTIINISGSYHGVSGTYSCTPGTDTCGARVAAGGGFELGLNAGGTFTVGTWTFTPSNAEARVMESEDPDYASYGWWIRKSANDGPFTASAFTDEVGTVPAATGLTALNGTATYVGGAAGKYALRGSTGGTNDAGSFTARAMLEANFTNNTTETAITGTIDNFMGADGKARDWSVKLNGSQIGDNGLIGLDSPSTAVDTVWTIGGDAADASGEWTGALWDNGDDLAPQVATGTFYSEYDGAGRMVGGFGANKQ